MCFCPTNRNATKSSELLTKHAFRFNTSTISAAPGHHSLGPAFLSLLPKYPTSQLHWACRGTRHFSHSQVLFFAMCESQIQWQVYITEHPKPRVCSISSLLGVCWKPYNFAHSCITVSLLFRVVPNTLNKKQFLPESKGVTWTWYTNHCLLKQERRNPENNLQFSWRKHHQVVQRGAIPSSSWLSENHRHDSTLVSWWVLSAFAPTRPIKELFLLTGLLEQADPGNILKVAS